MHFTHRSINSPHVQNSRKKSRLNSGGTHRGRRGEKESGRGIKRSDAVNVISTREQNRQLLQFREWEEEEEGTWNSCLMSPNLANVASRDAMGKSGYKTRPSTASY